MHSKEIGHALIDLDGTLWDEAPVKEALARRLTPEQQDALPGIAAEIKERTGFFTWIEVYREVGLAYVEELRQLSALIVPFPGVQDVLEAMSSRRPLWLVTDGARIYTELKLDCLRIGHYFTGQITSETFRRMKDDPEYWRQVIDLVGCTVESTVMIGDSLHDLLHPMRLGIRCIRIGTSTACSMEPAGVEHCRTFAEVANLLDG